MSEHAVAAANGLNGKASEAVTEFLREQRHSLADDWTISARIFNDPEIYELERERVFGRAWVFLGHETEIEKPGDYVVRAIMDDQFIVVRDEQGKVRAHFNSCRHRGMQVCRAELGNASHFRCPYHGWTYGNSGKLVGIPAGKEAYGNKLDKGQWGLRSIPQLDTYKGLIFGCLDPAAPPLEEFLGDMRFYLDVLVDRTDGGLEVIGAPNRWIIDADWKLGADNFVGDAYHTLMTHRSMVELGLAPSDPQFGMYGEHVHAGHGHGLGLIGAPPDLPLPGFLGLPDEIVDQVRRRLSPAQVEVLERTVFIHGTVFPNMSVLNVWISKDHMSMPAPMFTIRLWQPIGPGKMEVWSWFVVEKDGPDWYRQECYETYVRTFGPSGVFEQDDAENWRSITRIAAGTMAKGQNLNYQMGRETLELDGDWPGPGEAYPMDYAEANQRAFHRQWLENMTEARGNGHNGGSKPTARGSKRVTTSGA